MAIRKRMKQQPSNADAQKPTQNVHEDEFEDI
jgi:hypothetical protein